MKLETIAAQFAAAFEKATRDDKSEYYRLKEGSPEWMTNAIFAAHDGGQMLPEDTRYGMIRECADELAETSPDNWQDEIGGMADRLVDIMNWDLLKWVSSHLVRMTYCDDAQEQGLVPDDADMSKRLMLGQYMEYSEILNSLVSSFEELASDDDDETGE